jgi:alkylation response protein AidB-like acyl-CoA dehydrogenase
MDLEAARAMIWRAAYHWDAAGYGADPAKGEPEVRASLQKIAWGVSFALEAAMRAGDDAVQLHGGSGFMRDYPVEKWMRDSKQLQLCAMTAEQADQLAALIALDRPIDAALVLPSAESQNVFL